jgi:hypothetical protein
MRDRTVLVSCEELIDAKGYRRYLLLAPVAFRARDKDPLPLPSRP